MNFLISTDLDGTLLDHHSYQWQAATEAIELCEDSNIPIVFNTSKTLKEGLELQSQIGISGPMIVENGSALVLPKRFLQSTLDADCPALTELIPSKVIDAEDYVQILFGVARTNLLVFIQELREQEGWQLEGFNDWTIEQIVERTGLNLNNAKSASKKYYSEPFIWNDSEKALQDFIAHALVKDYKVLRGGRFYHLQGDTNKGIPILWLRQHILQLYGANCLSDEQGSSKSAPELICLGDNHNDIDMLNVADIPICVRSPVSDFPKLLTSKEVIYTEDEGPIGWNKAIIKIIKQ